MTFEFSGTLLRFTDYTKRVELDAASFALAVEALIAKYPGLRAVLFDAKGQMRKAHRLFLNGEMVGEFDGQKPLTAKDHVEILTSIAGG